jgi:hypothetical protein
MSARWTLGCDAADPQRLAAFWARALGYVSEPGYEDPDSASIIDPEGRGPAIGFLRVPEGKSAKNRVHIDVRVAGDPPWEMDQREVLIRAKVVELVAAGARAVREERYGDGLGHVVMLDPEGNEFCVA